MASNWYAMRTIYETILTAYYRVTVRVLHTKHIISLFTADNYSALGGAIVFHYLDGLTVYFSSDHYTSNMEIMNK